MVMTSGLNFGIQRTIPHFLGICVGFPAMVFAVGLGFGALFVKYHIFHEIIRIVGGLYMLYLAWRIATASTQLKSGTSSKPLTFFQAALFQWVNPKAWVMAIGAVSAYTSVGGNITYEIMTIAMIFLLVCLPCVGVWLVFGVALKSLLKNERQQRMFNYTMGLLLLTSILLMMFE